MTFEMHTISIYHTFVAFFYTLGQTWLHNNRAKKECSGFIKIEHCGLGLGFVL